MSERRAVHARHYQNVHAGQYIAITYLESHETTISINSTFQWWCLASLAPSAARPGWQEVNRTKGRRWLKATRCQLELVKIYCRWNDANISSTWTLMEIKSLILLVKWNTVERMANNCIYLLPRVSLETAPRHCEMRRSFGEYSR